MSDIPKELFNKKEARSKFETVYPNHQAGSQQKIRKLVTPEIIKKIVDLYPQTTNTEIGRVVGLSYTSLMVVIRALRKEKIISEKIYTSFEDSLEQSLKEFKNKK